VSLRLQIDLSGGMYVHLVTNHTSPRSIVGALVGLEYALEWLVSWWESFTVYHRQWLMFTSLRVPFYWELKTIFVLYLALPQTQVTLSFLRLFPL
jgi:hypothetical protein